MRFYISKGNWTKRSTARHFESQPKATVLLCSIFLTIREPVTHRCCVCVCVQAEGKLPDIVLYCEWNRSVEQKACSLLTLPGLWAGVGGYVCMPTQHGTWSTWLRMQMSKSVPQMHTHNEYEYPYIVQSCLLSRVVVTTGKLWKGPSVLFLALQVECQGSGNL